MGQLCKDWNFDFYKEEDSRLLYYFIGCPRLADGFGFTTTEDNIRGGYDYRVVEYVNVKTPSYQSGIPLRISFPIVDFKHLYFYLTQYPSLTFYCLYSNRKVDIITGMYFSAVVMNYGILEDVVSLDLYNNPLPFYGLSISKARTT